MVTLERKLSRRRRTAVTGQPAPLESMLDHSERCSRIRIVGTTISFGSCETAQERCGAYMPSMKRWGTLAPHSEDAQVDQPGSDSRRSTARRVEPSWIARWARRIFWRDIASMPSEAKMSTPTQNLQTPRVRFSGKVMMKPASLVSLRQAWSTRRARCTPTTTTILSSQYMCTCTA